MKIAVFSDSHGRSDLIYEVMGRLYHTCDVFIHAGDGAAELFGLSSEYPERMYIAVRGNCDGFSQYPLPREETLDIEGFRFFIAHGDRFGVKLSAEGMRAAALSRGADIAIFGHTHTQYYEFVRTTDEEKTKYSPLLSGRRCPDAVQLFNPGSIGAPRDGSPSWGIIEIRNGQALFSHGRL